jgi:hypothetical protein
LEVFRLVHLAAAVFIRKVVYWRANVVIDLAGRAVAGCMLDADVAGDVSPRPFIANFI